MAVDLEQSARESAALRNIADCLPMYADPDEGSRRMYWIVIEQRVAAAVRVGCSNEDICDALAVSRGLFAG